MRLRLLYSIFLFTLAVSCLIGSSEAKGHRKKHKKHAAAVGHSTATNNGPTASSIMDSTVSLFSSTLTISSAGSNPSAVPLSTNVTSQQTVSGTAMVTPTSSSTVNNTTDSATNPNTTSTTVANITTTETTTVTSTAALNTTAIPVVTIETTSTEKTTVANTTTPTKGTSTARAKSAVSETTTGNGSNSGSSHAVTEGTSSTGAPGEKKSNRTILIICLIAIPILIVAVVVAVLLYRKKQRKNMEANSPSSKSNPKNTPTAKSTVTPNGGPKVAPSQPARAKPSAGGNSSLSARNPARSDNESNRKMVVSPDDETKVELGTDREIERQKDPFGPPKVNNRQAMNMQPAQHISKGQMQNENNNGAPNTISAPQPIPMNGLVPQKVAELDFDINIGTEADDTQGMESMMDDYSEQDKKRKEVVEQIAPKKDKQRVEEKTVKANAVNVEMVNYGGEWRIVDNVGSDFSFSMNSMDDLA